ncbi:MAG: ArgE/DapE family deacylase [Candidatus Korarchaeota archaeon]|nr:ArgE/DapE family deacylase [Candidatus Korarchaeota archaeon]
MDPLSRDLVERIVRKVEEHRDQVFQLLRELVQIPSVTGQEGDAQGFVKEKLSEIGLNVVSFEPDVSELRSHPSFFQTMSCRRYGYKSRPNVVGTLEGESDGKTLILNGHIDVVPPGPRRDWRYDPWSGETSDGKMYGRGAGDMKGGLAAIISAVEVIQALDLSLKGKVLVESTIEEEDGGVGGALATLLKGYLGEFAIIPEPSGLDFWAASAGVLYFRVGVRGKPAHVMRAHEGVSAIDKIWVIYRALKELDIERRERISFSWAEVCEPDVRGNVTVLNIGVISGGDWPSTVPAWAEIKCRIGWPPGESLAEVEGQILRKIEEVSSGDPWLRENPPEYEVIGWRAEPSIVDPSDSHIRRLSDTALQITRKRPRLCGGTAGLDMRFFINDFGIPAVCYGPVAHNIHGINESVELESVMQVTKVLALMTAELLVDRENL